MRALIIYGSYYGTTKAYAEALSERINTPAVSYDTVGNLSGYTTVIHLGALYAGKVTGLTRTLQALPERAHFILVTVGLASVRHAANLAETKKQICTHGTQEVLARTSFFHLRGKIDYPNLTFKHRLMMAVNYHMTKRLPNEQKTPEVHAMLKTHRQNVNFVNFHALDQIIRALSSSS